MCVIKSDQPVVASSSAKNYQSSQPRSTNSGSSITVDNGFLLIQGSISLLPGKSFAKNLPLTPPASICIESSSITSPQDHPLTASSPVDSLLSDAPHQLCIEDFDVKQLLGTGTYGHVYLAQCNLDHKYYALKAVGKKDLTTERVLAHVQDEHRIGGMVDHPFLVKLWGTFQSETHLYFAMEYMPGGDLFDAMQKTMLTEDGAKFYAAEIMLGIEYLHQHDVAHRDLKPENILLDQDGHVRIADFGFAKVVSDCAWTLCGTPEYMAPEIIGGRGYTKAVDWWALGIMIFEMITGKHPFGAKEGIERYQKILLGEVDWPVSGMSPEAKDLVEGLLQTKPSARYGAKDIRAHPWFRSVDFGGALAGQMAPPFVPDVKSDGEDDWEDFLNF